MTRRHHPNDWTVSTKSEIFVTIVEARIESFLKTAHDPNEPEWIRNYFQSMADQYMALVDKELTK